MMNEEWAVAAPILRGMLVALAIALKCVSRRAAIAVACVIAGAAAAADTYPTRLVTIVVPYPAGGVVDVRVREVAVDLEKRLGQQVLVENRPGAMGLLGADRVAKSKPDGYTILAGSISDLAVVPALGVKMPFDIDKDLTPITQMVQGEAILVVPASMDVESVADLQKLIRQKPGELTYPTVGQGSLLHFLGRLFVKVAGAEAVDVPYKGGSSFLPDLVSGRLQFAFDFVPTSRPFLEGGKLRALLTTGARRIPILPQVPTAREAGLPELEIATWAGFFAPGGTPRPVIDWLNAAFADVLSQPALRTRWQAQGAEPRPSSPEDFLAHWRSERAKWKRLSETTGIKLE